MTSIAHVTAGPGDPSFTAPVPAPRLALALIAAFVPLGLTSALFVALAEAGVSVPPWLHGLPYVFTLYAIANLTGVAIVYAILGRQRLRELGLVIRFSPAKVWLALAAFVAGAGIFAVVNTSLRALGVPVIRGMPVELTGPQILVLFATVSLIVPFCEEVLFRTVWYMGLRQRFGMPVATVLSAMAFAAIHIPHFGIGGMIFISFWTLLPIALYARTRDITASWLMHTVNNAYAYVLVPLLGIPVPGA